MLSMEPITALTETGRDSVCRMSRVAVDGQQHFIGACLDALDSLTREGGRCLGEALTDMADATGDNPWPAHAARCARCANELGQLWIGIGGRWQGDLIAGSQAQAHLLSATALEEFNKGTLVARRWMSAWMPAGDGPGLPARLVA